MIVYLQAVAARLAALYRREPARFNSYASGVVLWAALQFGFEVDSAALAVVLPLVLSALVGEGTRSKVTPTKEKSA